jgi:hypothetical protein
MFQTKLQHIDKQDRSDVFVLPSVAENHRSCLLATEDSTP